MGSQPHGVCLTLGTEGGQGTKGWGQRGSPCGARREGLSPGLLGWVGGEKEGGCSIWGPSPWEVEPRPSEGQGAQLAGNETCKAVPRGRERMAEEQRQHGKRKTKEKSGEGGGIERARQGGGREKGAGK